MAPEPEAAGSSPAWRTATIRLAASRTCAAPWRETALPGHPQPCAGRSSGCATRSLEDLREVGADAATYIAHLDRSLRSRVFPLPEPRTQSLTDTLKAVRRHAKAVAREDSRLRRLRDQVGFGAYIEKFTAARRLNRRIIFHMGPTNSGKTYAALEMLRRPRPAPTSRRCGSWRWRTTRPCASAACAPAWSPARRCWASPTRPTPRAPSRPPT